MLIRDRFRQVSTFTSMVAMVAAAGLATLPVTPASAQDYGGRNGLVLVTPSGEILDRIPEYGSVRVYYNRRGQKVLVDRYGNLVATEMRLEGPADRGWDDGYGAPSAAEPGFGRPRLLGPVDRVDREALGPVDPSFDGTEGALPEVDREASLDQPGLTTGTVPDAGSTPDAGPAGLPPAPRSAPAGVSASGGKARPEVTALQVLLDREGISPGVIDGRMGSNVDKALAAYTEMTGQTLDPKNTDQILEALRLSGGLAITDYTITAEDAAGPFIASVPEDYSQKAELPGLNYTSTAEMLAERFHMDEGYLRAINPGIDFSVPGTVIKVVAPGSPKKASVARIVADKGREQVFAYDASGQLVAAYPATIGSTDTPSPSGTVTVERIAPNPEYTYNPKINFKQGENDRVLRIPPGPNGPVGSMWIALSKPTYGIHGTPEPSRIGKTNSHGCVRLTNWDAAELAKMIKPGVTVEFVD